VLQAECMAQFVYRREEESTAIAGALGEIRPRTRIERVIEKCTTVA